MDAVSDRAGERDHFIPARKIDVLDAVLKDGALHGEAEQEQFRQFARLLGAIYHYEYFDQLERLRNDYFYFSPELEDTARFNQTSFIDGSTGASHGTFTAAGGTGGLANLRGHGTFDDDGYAGTFVFAG